MSKKMSRLLVVLLCLGLLAVAVPVSAEETKSVMLNPFGFLFGWYNAEYEQVISDNMSFNVGGSFTNLKLKLTLVDWEISGVGGFVGVKRYFNAAPKGAWVGGSVGITSLKFTGTAKDFFTGTTTSTSKASGTVIPVVGLAGYKWIAGGGFTSEIAVGVSQTFGEIKTTEGPTQNIPTGYTGFGPAFKLQFGYSF